MPYILRRSLSDVIMNGYLVWSAEQIICLRDWFNLSRAISRQQSQILFPWFWPPPWPLPGGFCIDHGDMKLSFPVLLLIDIIQDSMLFPPWLDFKSCFPHQNPWYHKGFRGFPYVYWRRFSPLKWRWFWGRFRRENMARIKLKQVDGICKKPIPDAFSAFMRHCQLKNLSPYSYLYYDRNLKFFFE